MLKIDNYCVYDLEESIIASGLPMLSEYDSSNFTKNVSELKYWFKHGIIEIVKALEYSDKPDKVFGVDGTKCYKCGCETNTHLAKDGHYYCNRHYIQFNKYGETFRSFEDPNKIYVDESGLYAHVILINKQGEPCGECLVDIEDIPKVAQHRWHNSTGGYARNSDVGLMHMYLTGYSETDHINKNGLDNRRNNLRECTTQQNIFNRGKLSGYSNDIVGVNWSKHNSKWRAYITIDGKRQHLGCFEDKEEAIKCRLKAEIELFREYAPQSELAKKYGIVNPFLIESFEEIPPVTTSIKAVRRMLKLSSCAPNSGHNNFESGILVSADITASVKWWEQFQRYHFKQLTSSMSSMHRLRDMVKSGVVHFNEKTSKEVVSEFMKLINDDSVSDETLANSCPMGLELTARVTTNYLQLRTMYHQRKSHKLEEWHSFCEFIKTLPYAKELITGE